MIAISIANSVGSRRSSAPVVVVPVATAATGVGETSFTANWNAFAGANYYLLDVSLNSSFSSFVGSYQNYVTIGTSQLVSGLTPNTTYYYRLRAATGVDSDAAAFFSRVYTSGGVLSYTEVTATETLVYDMKTAGVWTAMKAVYPMIGASAAACAQNLKSSSFTGTFSSGWTFSSTGVTPNGTSAYMNSSFVPSTNGLTYDNNHLSFYSRTSAQSGAIQFYEMGSGNAAGNNNFSLFVRRNTDLAGYDSGDFTTNRATFTNTNGQGFYCGTAPTTTSKYFKNGTSQVSKSLSAKSLSNLNAYIGAFNEDNTTTYYSIRECSFASMGLGLSDAQTLAFYTAVQTFNQTLNRAVGPQVVSDADAQAYINRVYTAGGTLTNTEANAVNQLVIDMKGAGIWTAMKAVYPMVGASAAACAQNLKSSSFTGTFTSGWTFASGGVTGNGSSTYMDTTLIPSVSIASQDSMHLSYYANTNVKTEAFNIGVRGANNNDLFIGARFDSTNSYNNVNTASVTTRSETSNVNGFLAVSRINSSTFKYFKGNSVNQTYSITSTGLPNTYPIWLGALNLQGSIFRSDNAQCAFASIGDGLTDTQESNFYTAVQAFQTTLSRQV